MDVVLDLVIFLEELFKVVKKRKFIKEDEGEVSVRREVEEVEKEIVVDLVVNDEGMIDFEYMYKCMKRKVGVDLEEEEKVFE